MALQVSIEPLDAAKLDLIDVDTLLLPLYEVVGQPVGPAGYLDWRLCGRIGRLLRDGVFTGARGECHLLHYAGRINPPRIVLYGLGPPGLRSRGQGDRDAAAFVRVLSGLRAKKVGIGAPEPNAVEVLTAWLSSGAFRKAPLERLLLLDVDGRLADARRALIGKEVDRSA